MIRLIAIDLDDTLLDASASISERSRAALCAAMAAGCRVSLSSGRMLESMLPFARQLQVNAPMLVFNGALIYDPVAMRPVSAQRIPCETALGILELAERMGVYIQLYPGEGYWCAQICEYARAYERSVRVPPNEAGMPLSQWLRQHPCDPQKLLIIDTVEGADRAMAAIREAFPEGVHPLKSKPIFVEVSPAGVDKGRALAALAQRLGIAREEILAFGDGQNDVPMLEYAGIGCAVANACEDALRRADRIVPANTRDGVARVIEEYLRDGRIGGL